MLGYHSGAINQHFTMGEAGFDFPLPRMAVPTIILEGLNETGREGRTGWARAVEVVTSQSARTWRAFRRKFGNRTKSKARCFEWMLGESKLPIEIRVAGTLSSGQSGLHLEVAEDPLEQAALECAPFYAQLLQWESDD